MESGTNKKPNILVLTSFLSNDNSSKMIYDISKSLEHEYHVDVLCKYAVKIEGLNVVSVYNKFETKAQYLLSKIRAVVSIYKKHLFRKKKAREDKEYLFFGLDEEHPPVDSKRIISKLKVNYEFVLVFFWQGLITSKTLEDIYKKIQKPILLMAADMFPMTGGCSYFWDCNRLDKSCGQCPGLSSKDDNDITRKNFLFKKNAIRNINCIFLGNTWQQNHAYKSKMFNKLGFIYPIVDENVFMPRDRFELKKKFNYPDKIVLFFGALGVHDARKGFKYLVDALNFLANSRPDLVENIVLVVAGSGDEINELKAYSVSYTGHLSFAELAQYYALADVFLSPSIQDAGPMMLNQALMCGTPAVAFNIGTACDIINEKTGYLAEYRNSVDFGSGIIKLVTESKDNLINMQKECRIQSLERSSYRGFRNSINTAYEKIK